MKRAGARHFPCRHYSKPFTLSRSLCIRLHYYTSILHSNIHRRVLGGYSEPDDDSDLEFSLTPVKKKATTATLNGHVVDGSPGASQAGALKQQEPALLSPATSIESCADEMSQQLINLHLPAARDTPQASVASHCAQEYSPSGSRSPLSSTLDSAHYHILTHELTSPTVSCNSIAANATGAVTTCSRINTATAFNPMHLEFESRTASMCNFHFDPESPSLSMRSNPSPRRSVGNGHLSMSSDPVEVLQSEKEGTNPTAALSVQTDAVTTAANPASPSPLPSPSLKLVRSPVTVSTPSASALDEFIRTEREVTEIVFAEARAQIVQEKIGITRGTSHEQGEEKRASSSIVAKPSKQESQSPQVEQGENATNKGQGDAIRATLHASNASNNDSGTNTSSNALLLEDRKRKREHEKTKEIAHLKAKMEATCNKLMTEATLMLKLPRRGKCTSMCTICCIRPRSFETRWIS